MTDPIELTPELLAALKAQASEWNRGSLKINTMPFDPRVVLALVAAYETLSTEANEWRALTLDVFDAAVKANEERKE